MDVSPIVAAALGAFARLVRGTLLRALEPERESIFHIRSLC